MLGLIVIAAAALAQSVPRLINYQGRLTDAAGAPLDGETVDMRFEVYPGLYGDTMLWGETQTNVLVTGGLYHILLGSVNPIDPEVFSQADAYLQVIVNGDGYDSLLANGADCNDGDSSIHPGAPDPTGDGIDQNCDGQDLMVEVCDDSMDNDGDTLVDCADSDCANDPDCMEAGNCDDTQDNDLDGKVDCQDPDCEEDPACIESGCSGASGDEDGDGLTDCNDPNCAGTAACP